MRKSVKQELAALSSQELKNKAQELRRELFQLRMKKITAPEKDVKRERILRKNLATMLTFLQQKSSQEAQA